VVNVAFVLPNPDLTSTPANSSLPTGFGPWVTTAETWARAYLTTTVLEHKWQPPPRPLALAPAGASSDAALAAETLRGMQPGRPAELKPQAQAGKAKTRGALANPVRRADLFHRFFHHELQAAELMAWALLRFPDTPDAFRRGLLQVLDDEVRHMQHYAHYLDNLGYAIGAFPVRDWFWERVPRVASPAEFCATMGMGFEAGNLDHTLRFAEQLRAVNDEAGAALQELVHEEEIPHVRFALHWYRRFCNLPAGVPFDDFTAFRHALPAPLTPLVMKGNPVAISARLRAGFGEHFCKELEAWSLSGF
jgi:uncharacterized ferritin-like protein (DUF455 family)